MVIGGFRVTVGDDFWVRRYVPPTLSSAVVLSLIVTFALVTFGQGFDFAFNNERGVRSLLVLEALAHRWGATMAFWGVALMSGAMALLLSLVFRIQPAVWGSHVYLTAINVCMTISIAQAALRFDGGFGEVVLPLVAAIWHGLFVYLTNPFRSGG